MSTLHGKTWYITALVICWLFVTLFLDATYNCNLRSYLLITDYEPPIDSASDVLKYQARIWLAEGTGLVRSFKHSQSAVYRGLYQSVTFYSVVMTHILL